MATVKGKTSLKIDDLINDTVVSGHIDPTTGHLILGTRGGASLDAGNVVKPFGAAWSSFTTYTNGDIVGFAGSIWKATATSLNKCPSLFTSVWTRLTGESTFGWVERDAYFDSDTITESWQLFWQSGGVVASLDNVVGEFETGLKSLKLDMPGTSFQRIYSKEENIVYGGETVQVQVRAKLLSAVSGVTIVTELFQNGTTGKPEPFESGFTSSSASEGFQTLTTSWATYTFTMTAANAKPRAIAEVLISATAGAAVVLIDRIKVNKTTVNPLGREKADTLYLPKYQEYDSGWINVGDVGAPAFAAGSAYGGAFGIPRFRRIGDVVYMEGLIQNPPAANGTIFTLPAGFRPDGDIVPSGIGNAGVESHGIRVLASGVVANGTGNTGWTSMACQFPVAGGAYTWHVVGDPGEPAFGAGWANLGGGWQTARYTRIGDYVYMSGLVQRNSGTNQTVFTLPAGYRNTNGTTHTPAAGTAGAVGTDAGFNIGDSTSGTVNARGTGLGGYASLAGIRFFVGANDNKWKKFRGGQDGWYIGQGPYGAPWPVPALRRDGKIVFMEGLANVAATGGFVKLPLGYAAGQMDLRPIVNSTSKRLDTRSPNDDGGTGISSLFVNAIGVNGFTHSWVVADIFEGDIRWNG